MDNLLRLAILFSLLTWLVTQPALAIQGVSRLPICYNFSCKVKDLIDIEPNHWAEVSGWFFPKATTPAEERKQIKQAIGWMEVVVGKYTPTHRDTGLDLEYGGEFPGQLDCIDESLNTTTYLQLFKDRGLIRHHRVLERAYRRAIFDQHWAGQIQELETGDRYVVDSWFQKNGILPYIQEYEQWMDIPFFFSSNIDNSTEYDAYQDEKPSLWKRLKNRVSGQDSNTATQSGG